MKKNINLVLFFAVVVAVFLFWNYAHGLSIRFPELDFSRWKFGVASWYSEKDRHINEYTASGEKFSDQAITCASWNYHFGEKLLVINVLGGSYVVCRVNDRGPGKRLHRDIDLTKAAFKKISRVEKGLIYVVIIPTAKKK